MVQFSTEFIVAFLRGKHEEERHGHAPWFPQRNNERQQYVTQEFNQLA